MIRVTHYMRRPVPGVYSVERLHKDIRAHLPSDITVNLCISRYFSTGLFGRLHDLVRARRYQGDVNHVTGDVHFLTFLLDRHRTVLTILDFVPLESTRGFKRWLLWVLWHWLPEKRCTAIIAISDATRQQVLRYVGCAPDKIRVIHCNVSTDFIPDPHTFNAQCPRILHVGTTENKNLLRHIAALEGIPCVLVIIGKLYDAQKAELEEQNINYENHVELSNAGLVNQYRYCDLLLFASTYEGFGLPIVEANTVGRPVITSNVWSMPEVAGDAACQVDPYDVESIRTGILRVIDDRAYREQLVINGFENIKRFQVEHIAKQYADLYR